jgi:hypothetical protein
MTFSLYDFVLAALLQERPKAKQEFEGLTAEEIRSLQRMRAEVKLAREQVKLFVSQNRGHQL